ncbi:MAG: GNAT family N-acetyltransferase [Thermoplasmata archaeon]|nr:GNAT family N-acetyltransferase [Thermoplasmata archaeon]
MAIEVHPARELPRDELWNLVGTIRRELGRRGEILPPSWVDETVDGLAQGIGRGWFWGDRRSPAGLAVVWVRDRKAYGHLHGTGTPESAAGLVELGRHMAEHLGPDVGRLDMGSTGLSELEEGELGRRLSENSRFSKLLRHSMVRVLASTGPPPEPRWPEGVELTTVQHVPFGELTSLDWRTYRGTPDETLLSSTPAGNKELLENALAGLFGRYLDEASPAVRTPTGALLGFAVACQESLQSGILLDLAVDPDSRRRGLGEALLLRSLRALLALGYPRAHLWVTEGNTSARALYEKVGFAVDASAMIYRWVRDSTSLPPQPAASSP